MGLRRLGLIVGPLVFLGIFWAPPTEGLSTEAQRVGAVAALMAIWWVTEAVHLAITALLPLVLFPFLGIIDTAHTARHYANPNIFLFMGGFMIAEAMQKWNLHKRLALHVIAAVGGGPRRIIAGFMAATAFLSMWVTNTATAMMLLPVGVAVIGEVLQTNPKLDRFGPVLMLAIAYGASIGGVATLVGTPPNIIFVGQAAELFPEFPKVQFVQWSLFALPLSLGFLLITWVYLVFMVGRLPSGSSSSRELIHEDIRRLGKWSAGEKGVMTVFVLTALAWITRGDLQLGDWTLRGWASLVGHPGIHDGSVAILATICLFVIPTSWRGEEFLLNWDWAKRIRWDVLLLFGGGFALAEGFRSSGFSEWMGGAFHMLKGLPVPLLVFFTAVLLTTFTEFASNTAAITLMIPVLAAASKTLDIHPYTLMLPATVSASFAFMLPMATPPNAVVFGSGHLSIRQMAKAGALLNLFGALWVTLLTLYLAPKVFSM